MNWIVEWLADQWKSHSTFSAEMRQEFNNEDGARVWKHHTAFTRMINLVRKLQIARQERNNLRIKLAEAQASWRADLDSYSVILCNSGMGDLREKVRNLEHEIMGLMIAYRELSEARATIATLTQERDNALSRLGKWRPLIEAMEKGA